MARSFGVRGQVGTALLVFAGLAVGTAMRGRAVLAGGGECTPNIVRADLVEVRRTAGSGPVEGQTVWREFLWLKGYAEVEEMLVFAEGPGEADILELSLALEEAP